MAHTNPFTAADVKSVDDYYDHWIDKPTSQVHDELKEVKAKHAQAREAFGDGEDPKGLSELVDFGDDPKENMHRVADLTALNGALRKVYNVHKKLQENIKDDVEGRPNRLLMGAPTYDGPGLVELMAEAAKAAGHDPYDFSHEFKHEHTAASLAEHPIMNALFKRDAANPWQQRDPGALSTLRESPERLLRILPMRDVIGVQNTVKYRAKILDTQAATERGEGETTPESAYRWATWSTFVRSLATSIPMTDESIEDDPGAEERVTSDLMGELRIRLLRQVQIGSGATVTAGSGTPAHRELLGIANATSVPSSSSTDDEHDFPMVPSAREIQVMGYSTGGGGFNRNTVFDSIRLGIGQIENDEILENRMASHLVLRPDMAMGMELSRFSKSSVAAGQADDDPFTGDDGAEYVLGGPLAGRFTGMPWGLQMIPNTIGTSIAANGYVGMIGSFMSRNIELAIRRDIELRRGFVNDQFTKWSSTFATRMRAALVIYDGAAFCRLNLPASIT